MNIFAAYMGFCKMFKTKQAKVRVIEISPLQQLFCNARNGVPIRGTEYTEKWDKVTVEVMETLANTKKHIVAGQIYEKRFYPNSHLKLGQEFITSLSNWDQV